MKHLRWLLIVAVLGGGLLAQAAPWIGLVKSGTASQTSDSITLGTANYYFDVHLNTDGYTIDGLQYYIYTLPPWTDAVNYGATPLFAAGSPFAMGEAAGKPAAGATVNEAQGTTVWFTFGNDYPASTDYNIGTYQLNTGALGLGTYVFTFGTNVVGAPEPVLFLTHTNAVGEIVVMSDFETPGTFSLSIVPVPEPGACGLVVMGFAALILRKRQRSSPSRRVK